MKSALVLRHLAFEDLGAFAVPLENAGYAVRYLEAGIDDLDAWDAKAIDLLISQTGGRCQSIFSITACGSIFAANSSTL